VLSVTLHDLRFRLRQFLIAVVGAGLVFAMALLLTGLAESFRAEVDTTIDEVGADTWMLPAGASGPFTSTGLLDASAADDMRGAAGVEEAAPLVIVPQTADVDGDVRSLRIMGHPLGGLGRPEPDEGRSAERPGEAVADRRLGLDIGEAVEVGGVRLEVVGLATGLTLLGGVPNVYVDVEDAQELAFGGQPLATTIVTRGAPQEVPEGMAALTEAEVKDDTLRAMDDAIASIDNSRALMWIVAAVIVAALMYVSALERLRDFAVLKSLGSSSPLLFAGVALEAVIVSLLAAALAAGISNLMKPIFALPVSVPVSAFVVLPVVAVVVGLLSSLVALRRAVSVDPSSAFAAAS
jgi:putative ABC transport system permease protein